MSPYEILGLAEDESDERAIKRAYARLLKRHRPDQDPEGFTRIHQAYQRVMEWRDYARRSSGSGDHRVDPSPSPPGDGNRSAAEEASAAASGPATPVVPRTPTPQRDPPSEPAAEVPPSPPPADPAEIAAWNDAVQRVRTSAAATPLDKEALSIALSHLADLAEAGRGASTARWAAEAIDAVQERWELLGGLLDRRSMDHVLRTRRLADMQAVFKRIVAREGIDALGQWLVRWLEACEHESLIARDDGARALRLVAWSTLLDPALASRVVTQLDDSPLPRDSVHRADRLLAAGAQREALPEDLRHFLIARVAVGARGKGEERQVARLKKALEPLAKDDPLRLLAATQAGIRAPAGEERVGCLGGALGLAMVFAAFGVSISVVQVTHGLLSLAVGDVATFLVVGLIGVALWKRRQVWVLLDRHLFDPLTPAYVWACIWVSFVGAPMAGVAVPVSELMQRTYVLGLTIATLVVMANVRRRLHRIEREEGGWRVLVPPWIEALADPPHVRRLSREERHGIAVVSWVWAMAALSCLLLVEPLPSVRMISIFWLSGPVALLALSIWAWLVVWSRSSVKSWMGVIFWLSTTVVVWLLVALATPWAWSHLISPDLLLPPIIGSAAVLVLTSVGAAVAWVLVSARRG